MSESPSAATRQARRGGGETELGWGDGGGGVRAGAESRWSSAKAEGLAAAEGLADAERAARCGVDSSAAVAPPLVTSRASGGGSEGQPLSTESKSKGAKFCQVMGRTAKGGVSSLSQGSGKSVPGSVCVRSDPCLEVGG